MNFSTCVVFWRVLYLLDGVFWMFKYDISW
jgi:hypothetical protein